MPGTRKLGRPSDHRMAMLRAMVTYLLENGKIETTVTRAKEVRSLTEKMITVAKDNTLTAKRQALAFVTKEDVVKNLFDFSPNNMVRELNLKLPIYSQTTAYSHFGKENVPYEKLDKVDEIKRYVESNISYN